MKRAVCAIAIAASATAHPTELPSMNASASEASEIDQKIQVLLFPSGDRQFRLAREQAIAYLLEHSGEAHPRLLALVEGDSPPVTVLAALPRFGLLESVPVLEKALRSAADATTVVAGQALGQH